MILKLNIDVTKLSKNRLHKGAKGTYANLTVLMRDETDQYGNDGMIVEDVSKEDRESGIKGAIVGNAKIIGKQAAKPTSAAKDDKWIDDSTDIPF